MFLAAHHPHPRTANEIYNKVATSNNPCINCCKYLIGSGIKEVKYHFDYHTDQLVAQMLEEAQVEVSQI